MNSFEKLTELQRSIGYKQGPVNLIALFGLVGEAGEVLNEWYDTVSIKHHLFDFRVFEAIDAAKTMDDFKKEIRDKKLDSDENWFEPTGKLDEKFDMEISDALYYLNGLAIGRGKTLDEYARISFDKVSAKIQKNIQHGVSDLEMPKTNGQDIVAAVENNDRLLKGDFVCNECGENRVAEQGLICDECEFLRNQ